MSIELKPCPFCGVEPTMSSYTYSTLGGGYVQFKVECENDNCPAQPTVDWHYWSEAEAAEAWNTRAERTCVVEEVIKRERALGAPTWDYQLSCGHLVYEWPWKEAPAYCPDCGAKVVG